VVPVDPFSSRQTVEIVAALVIPSGPESDCSNSTGGHAVVVRLVCLNIVAKTKLAMACVVNLSSVNDSTRADCLGCPITRRERV
jgi:hypothetical protein